MMGRNVTHANSTAVPKIVTSLGVIILISLGWWQVERLQWKNAIIEKLQTATPMPINEFILNPPKKDSIYFDQVRFSGHYDFDHEFALTPRTHDGKLGHHVITPLFLENSNLVLLVNRGWDDNTNHKSQDPLVQDAIGIVRKDNEKNAFTPANVMNHNLLYYVDTAGIASKLKQLPQFKGKRVLDFYVVYKNPMQVGRPIPHEILPSIKNNHLGYAIIWFSLAASLLLLYIYRFSNRKRI